MAYASIGGDNAEQWLGCYYHIHYAIEFYKAVTK
jgi:hypothetical protein